MCNCGRKRIPAQQQQESPLRALAATIPAIIIGGSAETENVTVISPKAGFYTADSGNRYRSFGRGTKWAIAVSDRPSLERLGLIEAKKE